MPKAIEIRNLSKMYDLGLVGTGTLSKDLNRYWAKLRGKPDPYATFAELNNRTVRSKTNTVWALKDINLDIERGEVVGIIGKNGAGKSTLLKILSRITSPSTGTINMKGRVGSLLEVGTGMHPEMTARQNIFLNGSIMGMTRAEIRAKIDDIIDFAGINKFIDTPIKRFSSGMQVRLGFAVAAFLEPEILIVDEVLAVGDAEFQKKAIGKMQDISKGGGRTVLFVSHNMDSILRLCEKCVLLENAQVTFYGNTNDVVNHYLENNCGTSCQKIFKLNNNKSVIPLSIKVHDKDFKIKDNFSISEKIGITLEYEVLEKNLKVIPGLKVFNKNEINIFDTHENIFENKLTKEQGKYNSTVWIEGDFFNEGILKVDFALLQPDPLEVYFYENQAIAFNMTDKGKNITRGAYSGNFPGLIRPALEWKTTKF
jgi:lipopolysaccharide transport system ATP-binding protein